MKTSSFLALSLAITFCGFASLAAQSTFVVNSTDDPGDGTCDTTNCTLAEAIAAANALSGTDTVTFDIGGAGPHTIRTQSSFPFIEDAIVIDGYTQPGSAPASGDAPATILIELDGQDADATAHGLALLTNESTVRGLAINRFPRSGLYIEGSRNEVLGCYVGTNPAGDEALGNGFRSDDDFLYEGVWIPVGIGNRVGRTGEANRNVISGNARAGVWIDSFNGVNSVSNNYVGTDAAGQSALPNAFGIVIQNSPTNFVSFNTVSGNAASGIVVADFDDIESSAVNNTVVGNIVGLDASGARALPNDEDGILINASNNTIGGPGGERNVVSSNRFTGIVIVDPPGEVASTGNAIVNNYVGLSADGLQPRGNEGGGVVIEASRNVVGGLESGQGNVISANGFTGVLIASGDGGHADSNLVVGNWIGTAADGASPIGNGEDGIAIVSSSGNTIGGSELGAPNTIVSNSFAGVFIREAESSGNSVLGNWIGTNADGAILGNLDSGVDILRAQDNTIGGSQPGEGNVIQNNALAGINVTNERPGGKRPRSYDSRLREIQVRGGAFYSIERRSSAEEAHAPKVAADGEGNALVGNEISSNGGLAIDLGQDGDTPNDPDDADEGPNRLMNHPVISEAEIDTGPPNLVAKLLIDTAPASASFPITIDLYYEPACSTLEWAGSFVVTEDQASQELEVVLDLSDCFVTGAKTDLVATATDADGNTSEFSDPFIVMLPSLPLEDTGIPADAFALAQNFPNPLTTATSIDFALPEPSSARLSLIDLQGREIERLVDDFLTAGTYTYTLDASQLPAGVYLYRLTAGDFSAVRQMTVVH